MRYAYDLRGLQTAAWFTGNDWSVRHAYDGFGRMVSTTTNMGGFSRTVSHAFVRDGREVELTFPDGQKFWTARDGLGRTGAIHQGALGSSSPYMVGFAYNWANQLYYFARRYAEASVFAYDGPGWLFAIEDGFGGGIGNTRSEFLYNPAGQVRRETRSNDSYAWTGSVAVNRSYGTANGLNQYAGTVSDGAPSASFTYDANGNLTSDGTTNFLRFGEPPAVGFRREERDAQLRPARPPVPDPQPGDGGDPVPLRRRRAGRGGDQVSPHSGGQTGTRASSEGSLPGPARSPPAVPGRSPPPLLENAYSSQNVAGRCGAW